MYCTTLFSIYFTCHILEVKQIVKVSLMLSHTDPGSALTDSLFWLELNHSVFSTNNLHSSSWSVWPGASCVLPQRSHEGLDQRECWDICRLAEGPVVRTEGSGECTVTQSDDEVHAPQERNHVIDLQVKEVLLEQTLLVIVNEDAARRRTRGILRTVERLWRKTDTHEISVIPHKQD